MSEFYALRAGGLSPDLAYVVGVMLGDGCCYRMRTVRGTSWRIELKVRDREFADEFAYRLARTVKRPEKRRPHVFSAEIMWRVSVANRSFGDWWQEQRQDLSLLEPLVLARPAPFLRGLYDSEGNLTRVVRIVSSRRDTLLLARRALHAIDICGDVRLARPAGTLVQLPGKVSRSGVDLWSLTPRNTLAFLERVGSSIPRKAGWPNERPCAWCGVSFPIRSASGRQYDVCSRSCAAQRREARRRGEVMT